MNSLITLRPYGGLANRMQTIASCVQLAHDIEKPMQVIWINEKGLKSDFYDLFKPSEYFIVRNDPPLSIIRYPSYLQLYHNYLSKYFDANKIGKLFYESFFYGVKDISTEMDALLKSKKNIYITSCEIFRQNFPIHKLFIPCHSIQQNINKQVESFGEHCIGVHIRRTDNIYSIQQSPTNLFIEKMQESIEKNDLTKFFIATDCVETLSLLKKRFGVRIIYFEKNFSRNSKKGIQDAVVDLFCLSKSNFIFGSSSSSFSKIASELTMIPLQILRL